LTIFLFLPVGKRRFGASLPCEAILSSRSVSYDKSVASSKASFPQSVIQFFIFQVPVSFLRSSSSCFCRRFRLLVHIYVLLLIM